MTFRRLGAIAAITACFLVTSCGGSSDSSGTAGPSSGTNAQQSASKGKPSTPLDQLLPTASDFPPGLNISHLDPANYAGVWDNLKSKSSFTPEECGPKFIAAGDNEQRFLGGPNVFGVATNPVLTYTVAIADLSFDLAPTRDYIQSCPNVHRTIDLADQPIDDDVRYQPVELPAQLPHSDAFSYATDVDNNIESAASTIREVRGIAVLRGVTVLVIMQGLGGAVPDRGTFADLFTKSTKKVADAA
jgi:hypothetical protein